MNDPLEDEAVAEFVLESEANIDVARRMATVFPLVQRKIVGATLDELETDLRRVLDSSWEIYNCRDELGVENYPGFAVSRKSWGAIYINLGSHERGSVCNS